MLERRGFDYDLERNDLVFYASKEKAEAAAKLFNSGRVP